MNIEELISIYRKGGYNIFKICDCYFYSQGWINYSFPFLNYIPINNVLINSLKWKFPLSILKTELRIKNTYEFILKVDDYDIDKFKSKVRNLIRRSLKDCEFRRPSLADMLQTGLDINRQTVARHCRSEKFSTTTKKWRKFITSFCSNEHVNILGAYINNNMVGYIIAYELQGKHIIVNPYYDRKASSSAPMNGLIYTLVTQLIAKHGSIVISYGLDSFIPLPNLNRFKENMLFKRIPTSRVYLISPIFLLPIKLVILFNLRFLKRKSIRNTFTRKLINLYQGYRLFSKEKKLREKAALNNSASNLIIK